MKVTMRVSTTDKKRAENFKVRPLDKIENCVIIDLQLRCRLRPFTGMIVKNTN